MNVREAREFLLDTIYQLKQSKIAECKPFITTLKNWQEVIIQSCLEVDEETREVINNKIKVIKQVS